MSASLAASPLLLALLAAMPATAQPAAEEWDTGGELHVVLTADNAGQAQAVHISPSRATTFVFHAPLQHGGVVVESREFFRSVTVDEAAGVVTLLPAGELPPGRELLLTARFADGAVPEWATFRLMVHPTRAERQVEVYRQARSAESFQQGEQRERERAERCEADLERTRVEEQRPGGLVGLFDAGLVGESTGVAVKRLTKDIAQRPGETLRMTEAHSYRANRRVALELKVSNTGTRPWTAEGVDGAELVSTGGGRLRVLRVWPPEPILPGDARRLVVEAEATEEERFQGAFLLKLSEAGGPRTITLRGVTFP